jgi:trimethyllysine dioxygenase
MLKVLHHRLSFKPSAAATHPYKTFDRFLSSIEKSSFTPSSVQFKNRLTNVLWKDGHNSSFLNAWLRDHCHCSECYDTTTAQRSSDTLSMGVSSEIRSTDYTVNHDKQQLNLTIQCPGTTKINSSTHTCVFPLHWLRNNCYSSSGIEERRQASHKNRNPWDPSRLHQMCAKNGDSMSSTTNTSSTNTSFLSGLPSTPYNKLSSNPTVLRDQLQHYGIAFVSDVLVPDEDTIEQCKKIVNNTVRDFIGFPRETLWGTLWDTQVSEDAPDTAYTNIALRPHVDCTYLRDPPELQIFLCAAESDDEMGGSSTFVDGLRVAEEMYTRDSDAFNFFSKTQLGFQCIQDGVHSIAYGKVFETEPGIENPNHLDVTRFRYNNDDRSAMHFLSSNDVEKFYKYIPLLLELLRDDHFVLKTRLKKGTMAIVNNHRVLHGRESFEGTRRNLVGCYAELSEAVLPSAVKGPIPPPNNQL